MMMIAGIAHFGSCSQLTWMPKNLSMRPNCGLYIQTHTSETATSGVMVGM